MKLNVYTIKDMIRFIGRILTHTHIDDICNILSSVRNLVYTGYICRDFAKIGKGSVFYWRIYTLVGQKYIHIGNNCIFEKGIQLTARKTSFIEPEIRIGCNCLIRACAHITATSSIKIGDNLLTGTNVLITDNMHGNTDLATMSLSPRNRPIISKGNITIGNNVWLGNNVCIMPGVTIGDSAVVGANSVVTHDVPAYCLVAGIPAKILKDNYRK